MRSPAPCERRREQGSALLLAVLMLVMMGFLGLAALESVARDREVAGFQNRSRNAFYAAEAGVAEARSIVAGPFVADRSVVPAFASQGAPQTIGDAATYDREFGLPNYYGDPAAVPGPIAHFKDGPPYAEGGNLGKPKFRETYWRIQVVGESPDGSRSRIEAVASKLLSSAAGPTGYSVGG